MPHAGGDDFASTDEVRVYKDEGEDEKRSSENFLSEDKLGLVTETEEGKSSDVDGHNTFCTDNNSSNGPTSAGAKLPDFSIHDHLPFGYPLLSPYPYPNGSTLGIPGKIFPPHPTLGFFVYGSDPVSHPPPAHMGIPPLHIDYKTGIPRPPLYGIGPGPGQLAHSLYRPDFPPWNGSPRSFHGPYPPSLSQSPLAWFPAPGLFSSHPGISHPAVVTSGSTQDLSPVSNHSRRINNFSNLQAEKKRNYIKKPLNAFMLFMKEMRQKVIEECTLKESAAINQILGRKWHALERAEQAKYYEMARKEKELHMQLYPGWSARDNYATHTKKKKLKREHQHHDNGSADFENHDVLVDDFTGTSAAKKFCVRYSQEHHGDWCNFYKSDSESVGDGDIVLTNAATNITTSTAQSQSSL